MRITRRWNMGSRNRPLLKQVGAAPISASQLLVGSGLLSTFPAVLRATATSFARVSRSALLFVLR